MENRHRLEGGPGGCESWATGSEFRMHPSHDIRRIHYRDDQGICVATSTRCVRCGMTAEEILKLRPGSLFCPIGDSALEITQRAALSLKSKLLESVVYISEKMR